MMGHMFGNGWSEGNWDSMPEYMREMMQNYYGGASFLWQFAGILDFITQILFVILLLTAIRWFWKKGR